MAVIAAILKSGLRIMPHSGGRVGKGIYFASENSKSAGYGEGPGPTEFVGAQVPLHTSCQAAAGNAKTLPCHGSQFLRAGVAWAQPNGNTRVGAIIPIPFSHGSGLHIQEGWHHVPDGGGPGQALPHHL